MKEITNNTFADLGLKAELLRAINELGYEIPTPAQQQAIPVLLQGNSILVQAQTGTGKTAVFALSILQDLKTNVRAPQALILTPTRELAIQVAESFKAYGRHLPGFQVLPIYGGSDFRSQKQALDRGVHVIVGTPGRVMDHLRRQTISLDSINTIILDEADEMLKMGFIDDVGWIFEQIPTQYRAALFSATMPTSIRKVAERYLKGAPEILIKNKTTTVQAIEQFQMIVANQQQKLDALTRFLEVETTDAIIIFTRTKNASEELAEKLSARGYSAAALNGDMSQSVREKTINSFKRRRLTVLVATDVAARGLDVDDITHVVNYDVPHDSESYVHRIGRTGRAGRKGRALTLVHPRERRMIRDIEHATKQAMTLIKPPTVDEVNGKRLEKFSADILAVLQTADLDAEKITLQTMLHDSEYEAFDIAAALIHIAQADKPALNADLDKSYASDSADRRDRGGDRGERRDRSDRGGDRFDREKRQRSRDAEPGMVRCRLNIGRDEQVKPGDIVGAITNTADISSKNIGAIQLFDQFSLVDIDEKTLDKVMKISRDCWIRNRQVQISLDKGPEKKRAVKSFGASKPFAARKRSKI